MNDWKSALAALVVPGGSDDNVSQPDSDNLPDDALQDAKDAERRKRQQKLRLNMERAGRGGKTVTLIKGFVGTDDEISALCKMLKQRCGVGGSVKDGEIIIQGDHRTRLIDILKQDGYTNTK